MSSDQSQSVRHFPARRRNRLAVIDQSIRSVIETLEDRMLLTVALDSAGWTQVTPTPGVSRLIYVSSSSGSDANNGLSPANPLRTIGHAVTLLRNNSPDWILLERGDTFNEAVALTTSGVSTQEPMVFTNYGNPSLPRPVIDSGVNTGMHTGANNNYLDIIGITFTTSTHNPSSPNYLGNSSQVGFGISDSGTSNILIEDCSFSYFIDDLLFQPVNSQVNNVTVRRNEVLDSYSINGNSEGLYAEHVNGITIEDNFFDHDGWNNAAGAGPTGYNHDAYLHSSDTACVVTGNVFAEASSVGLEARGGGIVDNNLFVGDPFGMTYGLVNGSTTHPGGVSGQVVGNVVIEPRVDNNNGWGIAMQFGNLAVGGNTLIADNIVADASNNTPAIQFTPGNGDANPQQEAGLNSTTFTDNVVYHWGYSVNVSGAYNDGTTGADGLTALTISNNDFQQIYPRIVVQHGNAYNAADETWSGNTYSDSAMATSGWFSMQGTTTSLAKWQATVEPTAINKTVPFTDPTRTIESYMGAQGVASTLSAFVAGGRALSSSNWNPMYVAPAVLSYMKAGFTVGATGPQAVLTPPPDVTALNYQTSPSPTFTVTYADNVALNSASIGSGDLTITGPGNVTLPVSLVSTVGSGDVITATYRFSAATGDWTTEPAGTYVISLVGGQITDVSGRSVPGQTLGTFQVGLNPSTNSVGGPATTPINFSASGGTSSIKLTWSDPAGDETSYIVKRATNGSMTQNVQSFAVSASATSYTDSTAVVGTTYFYELIAVNSAGSSSPTPVAAAVVAASGPPSLTLTGNPYANANTPYSLNLGPITDVGQNSPQYFVHWGDGSTNLYVSGGIVTHTYGSALGPIQISVDVLDTKGTHANVASLNLSVNRATVVLAGNSNANPNASYSLTLGPVNDPGFTASQYIVHWGDGSSDTYTTIGAKTHTYSNSTTSALSDTITVDLVDDSGAGGANATNPAVSSESVTVNPNPTVSVGGAANANAGGLYTLTLGTPVDPGFTVSQLVVNWGDGSAATTVAPGTTSVAHTFSKVTAPNSDSVTVAVVDNSGTYAAAGQQTVTVNPAPTLPLIGSSTTTRGTAYGLTLGFPNDPGQTISQYTINWGDGVSTTSASPGNFAHVYNTAGNATITVDLTDGTGTFLAAGTLAVKISNTATIAISGNANANAGGIYTLKLGAVADPGQTVSQYQVNWGDGTSPSVYTSAGSVTHTYASAGSDTISVDLTDAIGTYPAAGTLGINVNKPTLALSGHAGVFIGQTYSLTLDPSGDLGGTPQQYVVHWGDGSNNTYSSAGPTTQVVATHAYSSAKAATLTADLVDNTGTFTSAGSLPITIGAAPTVTLSGSANTNVGGLYMLSLTGVNDPLSKSPSFLIHWGDNVTSTVNSLGNFSHIYSSTGPKNILVDVADPNGTYPGAASLTLNVNQPSVALTGNSAATVNLPYSLNIATPVDPGHTVAAYMINWGDGQTTTYTAPGIVTHTYTTAGNRIVSAALSDDTGTYWGAGTQPVNVSAGPLLTLSGNNNANSGGTYSLTLGPITDPYGKPSKYLIHWGDGTTSTSTSLGNFSHVYSSVGAEKITVDVTDPGGTWAAASTMTVTVDAAPSVAISGSNTATAGSVYTLNLGAASDPGYVVSQYIVHWGDGQSSTYTAGGAVTHIYAAKGAEKITVDLSDATGTWKSVASLSITVNAAATKSTTPAATNLFTTSADIGAPKLAGSSSFSSGTYTVDGSGADIGGASDQFHYNYTTVSGNTTIIADVATVQNTSTTAKAGVMIRASTAANAAFADVVVTPAGILTFQYRTTTGGAVTAITLGGKTAPQWVKLVRTGNSFVAWFSSNGINWTQLGSSATIAMSSSVLTGLAVTSASASKTAAATFTNVSVA